MWSCTAVRIGSPEEKIFHGPFPLHCHSGLGFRVIAEPLDFCYHIVSRLLRGVIVSFLEDEDCGFYLIFLQFNSWTGKFLTSIALLLQVLLSCHGVSMFPYAILKVGTPSSPYAKSRGQAFVRNLVSWAAAPMPGGRPTNATWHWAVSVTSNLRNPHIPNRTSIL